MGETFAKFDTETDIPTPEDFADKIQGCLDTFDNPDEYPHYDEEDLHRNMDRIMADTLRALGYGAGIDIFLRAPKWYA